MRFIWLHLNVLSKRDPLRNNCVLESWYPTVTFYSYTHVYCCCVITIRYPAEQTQNRRITDKNRFVQQIKYKKKGHIILVEINKYYCPRLNITKQYIHVQYYIIEILIYFGKKGYYKRRMLRLVNSRETKNIWKKQITNITMLHIYIPCSTFSECLQQNYDIIWQNFDWYSITELGLFISDETQKTLSNIISLKS